MAELYIFSPDDKLLTIITEETGLVSAWFREELNQVPDTPFSFTIEADSENAQYVVEENQVVFRDKEGEYRLYVIKELDDIDNIDGPQTKAICLPAFLVELKDHIIVDRRFIDKEAQEALDGALDGTRWTGEVEVSLGLNSTNFYYMTSVDAIWNILSIWGGEFKDVVEFDGKNNIVSRKIKILQRRGADRGKRFEIDHDIEDIQRTVLSYPVTALYGRGASLPATDEEGNETGAFTRYIDFADVEWKKSNGDPVDKPKGQKWVGDPDALQKYGYLKADSSKLHRYGVVQNQNITDPVELLQWTWEQLQKKKKPEVNYALSVHLLEMIAGYEHEHVELGDTARAIDRLFARPIEIQSRVIAIEYDLVNIEDTAKVEMGQFLSAYQYDDTLDKVVETINNNRGKWEDKTVTNDNFPDIKPGTPTNVEAIGGFKVIQLYWEYDSNVFISHYEVYGSQVKDFVPDSQHLLYRGKVSSFAHEVNTDEVWYYRVRAVNTRGTPGDFSPEVSASTVRIISDDILFGEDIASELRELSKTAQLLADGTIDLSMIGEDVTEEIESAKTSANDAMARANTATQQATDAINQAQTAFDDAQNALCTASNAYVIATTLQGDVVNLSTLVDVHTGQISVINQSVAGLQTQVNDIDDNVSTVTQTVSSLTTRISDAEGNITALQQTSTSFATRISTAEGNISTLTATVNGLQTTVSNVQGDVSSVTQLASALQVRMTNAEGDINTLTATANSLTSSITAVRSDLDNLEVGGRNLYKNSKGPFILEPKNTGHPADNYNYYRFYCEMELNETYTISADIEITHGDFDKVTVYPYPGGNTSAIPIPSNGRIKHTFVKTSETIDSVLIYAGLAGSTRGQGIIIRNVKLEKGNRATDWTPAPEDLATQSQFTQLADAINLRVSKNDIINQINVSTEGILIGGNKIRITGQTLIDNGVIKSAHIADAAITSAKIANLAVGTAAIADAAITSAKIANLAVGTAQIQDGAITNAKIANITADKINVSDLSAISANLGTVTAGNITGVYIKGSTIEGGVLKSSDTYSFDDPKYRNRTSITSGIVIVESIVPVYGYQKVTIGAGCLTCNTAESDTRVFTDYKHGLIQTSGSFEINTSRLDISPLGLGPSIKLTPGLTYTTIETKKLIVSSPNFNLTETGLTLNLSNGGFKIHVRGSQSAVWWDNNVVCGWSYWGSAWWRFNYNAMAFEATTYNGNAYFPITASGWNTASKAEFKTDIKIWEESALEKIRNSTIYEYLLKEDESRTVRQGVVIGEGYQLDPEIIEENETIDQYRMNSWSWKAIQELDSEQQIIKDRLNWLEIENQYLKQKIQELEAKQNET